MTLAGYNLQDNVYIYSNNKCMCVFLISPVPIAEPLTSELIDTPVFYNLAPRPIKYRVSVPIPSLYCSLALPPVAIHNRGSNRPPPVTRLSRPPSQPYRSDAIKNDTDSSSMFNNRQFRFAHVSQWTMLNKHDLPLVNSASKLKMKYNKKR